MHTLVRPDATLHIRDDGPRDGRPVVFANSLGTDLRVWDALLPMLPPGLRIVRFDKRGHGLSDAPPAPYRLDTLVDDAEALCETLGLTGVTFVGLSIGGLIGQGLAAKRPDLLRALVLMDTAAQIGSAEMWQARIDTIRAQGIAALQGPIMERWFTAPFRDTNPEFALWCNMLTRTTVEGYIGCCAAIAAADLTESTRALRLPVLALAGDEDGSTPPDLVRATAALCGAEFHLIPDAGHIPCVEQPAATAARLTAFLERTAG
ncbi:3-oxoadipate enol-lactonase [Paenirhodobacter sp.]|uniref:3-oxoadipate enol-lactonase n=1 Tax=Paenirhodobacter sp. TaxID=1965326 RepID=UPI003B3E325F